MAKTRVHELAKEFGVESKFVLEKFKEMGEFVKSASSTVELPAEMRFRKEFGEKLKAEAETIAAEGWKWIEVSLYLPYGYSHGLRRPSADGG